MKILLLTIFALLIIFSCVSVAYDSLKKNHFKHEPEIIFYREGKPVWKEHGTHEDAERIMESNPQFEIYEMEE